MWKNTAAAVFVLVQVFGTSANAQLYGPPDPSWHYVSAERSLTISPPSGIYLADQQYDLAVFTGVDDAVVIKWYASLDGVETRMLDAAIPGGRPGGGEMLIVPHLSFSALGSGSHVLHVSAQLNNGTVVHDIVVWTVLGTDATSSDQREELH